MRGSLCMGQLTKKTPLVNLRRNQKAVGREMFPSLLWWCFYQQQQTSELNSMENKTELLKKWKFPFQLDLWFLPTSPLPLQQLEHMLAISRGWKAWVHISNKCIREQWLAILNFVLWKTACPVSLFHVKFPSKTTNVPILVISGLFSFWELTLSLCHPFVPSRSSSHSPYSRRSSSSVWNYFSASQSPVMLVVTSCQGPATILTISYDAVWRSDSPKHSETLLCSLGST